MEWCNDEMTKWWHDEMVESVSLSIDFSFTLKIYQAANIWFLMSFQWDWIGFTDGWYETLNVQHWYDKLFQKIVSQYLTDTIGDKHIGCQQ